MGQGCQSVTRTATPGIDLVVGVWDGERIGTFRGIRDGKADYGVVVFGSSSIELTSKYEGYQPLVEQIAKFFQGGEVPVSNQETLELFAFMEAAQQSKEKGGVPVKLADVMAEATEKAKQKVAELDR